MIMGQLPSVRVVGHPSAPSGMGEHARGVILSLASVGVPVDVVDVYGHWPLPRAFERQLTAFTDHFGTSRPGTPVVDIYAINADEIDNVAKAVTGRFTEARHRVIFPHWELSTFPSDWAHDCQRFDAVWAASSFSRHAFTAAGLPLVSRVGISSGPGETSFVTRARFCLPEDRPLVLTTVHLASYTTRKNPQAAVAAVRAAQGPNLRTSPFLVVNVAGAKHEPATLQALKAALGPDDETFRLVAQDLPHHEYLGLLRSSDVFLSLHRSEGFGLAIAEAMRFGKPCVVTDYGGSADFCTPETSRPVPYRLVALTQGDYPRWEDQVWADPDIRAATGVVTELAASRETCVDLGRRARREIVLHWSWPVIGTGYLRTLGELFPKVLAGVA